MKQSIIRKKYNNYDEFLKEYVIKLLAERLKMLCDIGISDPEPNYTPMRRRYLDSTTNKTIPLGSHLVGKVFGPKYDRNNLYTKVKMRSQHIINIASYLRQVVQSTNIKES